MFQGQIVRVGSSSRGPEIQLRNLSGYDTTDLALFIQRALGAAGVRRPKRVVVTTSPIYTRGCAAISPDRPYAVLNLAIASPSRFTVAKLARILEHEARHLRGEDHGDMPGQHVYTDAASVPAWARGLKVPRYVRRAGNQLGAMNVDVDPRVRGSRLVGGRGRRRGRVRKRRTRR